LAGSKAAWGIALNRAIVIFVRVASLVWLGLAVASLLHGCSSDDRSGPAGLGSKKPYAASASSSSGGDPMLGVGGGAACSDEGACGTETHAFTFDAPNLYFVFDASGSMLEDAPGKSSSRYSVVRETAIDLVESLGPLINVGATLYPAPGMGCDPGNEVMPVTPGDSFEVASGPTLAAFKDATSYKPKGGTPTAATLEVLLPKLAVLKGKTVVLLLTDGGPNCNPDLLCGPEECMPVIEGDCAASAGCCDPAFMGGGPRLCVDRVRTVQAIEAIHALGVDVYVIGVADLAAYQDVLDDMAIAGGVPDSGSTKYTEVKDLDELGSVFASIAAQAIPCDVTLKDPPADKGFTNVYFGCAAVPFDASNGWTWSGDATVTLHGDACKKLKSGKVEAVKVVTGCPTEVPK